MIESVQLPTHHQFIDLTGKRFGRLVVVRFGGVVKKVTKWVCRCDCGNEKQVNSGALRQRQTNSCGCWRQDSARIISRTHGLSKTAEYKTWQQMIQRCDNQGDANYPNYGGRGISVCEKWQNFENFYADMGKRPSGMSIDRKDNDGNYEPGNCRWATLIQQNRNRRSTRNVTYNGQTLCVSEWALRLNITPQSLSARLARGHSIESALSDGKYRLRESKQGRIKTFK